MQGSSATVIWISTLEETECKTEHESTMLQ